MVHKFQYTCNGVPLTQDPPPKPKEEPKLIETKSEPNKAKGAKK